MHADDAPASRRGPAWRALALAIFGLAALRLIIVGHAPHVADSISLALVLVVFVVAKLARLTVGDVRHDLAVVVTVATAVLASVAAADDATLSLFAAPSVLLPVVTFAVARHLEAHGRTAALLALVVAALLHALVALHQRFVTWPDALARADELALEPSVRSMFALLRPIGLSLSPDLMSGIVVVGLAAAAALASTMPRVRVLFGILSIPLVAALVVARSTTSFAALGVALACAFALRGRVRLVLVAVATSAVLFGVFGRGVAAALTSLSERVENWRAALSIAAAHPVLGVGPGGFADAYASARTAEQNVTLYAHSFPLHAVAELGLFGVALAAAACFVVGRALLRARGAPPSDVALACGLAFALVRALVDYDGQVAQSAFAFALIAGLASPPRRQGAPPSRVVVLAFALFTLAAGLLARAHVARDVVLEPFERGGAPDADDVAALLAYADAHPRDRVPATLAARIVTEAALACRTPCEDVLRDARARVDRLRADEAPSSMVHFLAARHALAVGDHARAIDEAGLAIARDTALFDAHALRLRIARDRGDSARVAQFLDEARALLPPARAAALEREIATHERTPPHDHDGAP